ncbi:uncharacterized protein C8Q71DRAFT_469195 [Rhodofomes roseus]|uniref:Uncharacterized protein n=1 Tax=Rhodofomes roseus TaxID=34475 RepID=A0ABQ8KP59_9APHY|nr:uncharacterized protein C8Q71DRAFT_469195 [Rhodofomes roseus]KAH9839935.1 hypothetical protein C8Q71DRAFT_469195 [Rhodofomes roseus]
MPASAKMIVIPLPVVPAARSTIAPAKEPQPDLPPPFKPRSVNVARQDLLNARDIDPFPLLPRVFIPIPHGLWRPPVMHYGWPAPTSMLLSYAEEHGLVLKMRRRNPDVCFDDDSSDEDESVTEDDANDDAEDSNCTESSRSSKASLRSAGSRPTVNTTTPRTRKPVPPVARPSKDRVDQCPTMMAALRRILSNLTEKTGMRYTQSVQVNTTLQDREEGS